MEVVEVGAEAQVKLKLVSRQALVDYMKSAGHTIRSLADKSQVHRCTIGRLHSGKQKTLDEDLAKRLEQELGAPDGRLFRAPAVTCDSCGCAGRKSRRKALVA